VKCSWVKFEREEVKCRKVYRSVVKCSESLSTKVCNIIGGYIDHRKFAAFVDFPFIIFVHVRLVLFFITLYMVACFVYFCLIL
jgi:hypothetical protein